MKNINLATILPSNDIDAVRKEIFHTLKMISSDFDFDKVEHIFSDLINIFQGNYSGYQACTTEYHDVFHTLDATLAFVRIVHGNIISGKKYDLHNIYLGYLATLFHDTGYILEEDDKIGSGAKNTLIHVELSIDFVEKYLQENGYSDQDFEKIACMIKCTGLHISFNVIKFQDKEIEELGKILGAADLLGQMSDRNYLEKLLFLVKEFEEGNVPGFNGEVDLLKKTILFKNVTYKRLDNELEGLHKQVHLHFKARYQVDRDLYVEAIENHINYIDMILKDHPDNYRDYLRRGSIVKKFVKKFEK